MISGGGGDDPDPAGRADGRSLAVEPADGMIRSTTTRYRLHRPVYDSHDP
jgi:hypothetical protein